METGLPEDAMVASMMTLVVPVTAIISLILLFYW